MYYGTYDIGSFLRRAASRGDVSYIDRAIGLIGSDRFEHDAEYALTLLLPLASIPEIASLSNSRARNLYQGLSSRNVEFVNALLASMARTQDTRALASIRRHALQSKDNAVRLLAQEVYTQLLERKRHLNDSSELLRAAKAQASRGYRRAACLQL